MNSIIGKNQIYFKTKGKMLMLIISILPVRKLTLTGNCTSPGLQIVHSGDMIRFHQNDRKL